MKATRYLSGILCAFCLLALLASPVLAENITQGSSLAGQLTVSHVEVDPSVLMREDTGLVTITVTNTGSESVTIKRAELSSKDLTILNYKTYATVGTIGKGNSMDFTFAIQADPPDGVYYPKFNLDLGTESFRSYVPIKIESTPIDVSVTARPDIFSSGAKEEITLVVGNPRENTLSGITITPQGEGIVSTQTRAFIGDLAPGKSEEVTFTITPTQEGDLTFLVEYRNGINPHNESVTIPITFGTDKMAARPMINNIEISSSGTTYTLSADVTNAGLSDARSIVVTVGSPAQPTDPNPVYIVGTLEPDDFSSFDLTFLAPGVTSVPLILQYKDANGNDFEETFTVNLRGDGAISNSLAGGSSNSTAFGQGGSSEAGGAGRGQGMFGGFGSGINKIPFVEIALIIVAGVVLAVAWRKGYLGKIKARLRR